MPYIGQNLQVAQRRYESVDDISGSFNGSTTSFALQVGGVTPAPFPVASENLLVSVGGVIQEPDGTGTNGFQLTGTNIVFSSAPAAGQSFFGVILAGADYVTAGHAFPDGDAAGPSITFSQDLDTGVFRAGSGAIGFGGDGSEHARLDGSGRLLVGTTTARAAGDVTAPLQVEGTGFNTSSLNLISNAGASSGNVSHISLAKSRGTADGSSTIVADDDNLGTIQFCGADGTDLNSSAASISAAVDGTPGSNDMPGRLVFSTTADGASSPTERMRIDSNGTIHMGDRASAGNAQHFSTATVNISKSDDLATSFSKTACFLHIGNASSTLNGVYPIGFGFSTNDRTHLPAYIQYITTDSAGAEHGPLTFGTRNVTTDTAPSERMRITSTGAIRIGMTDFTADVSATNPGLQLFNTNAGAINSSSAATTNSDHALFFNPNGIVGRIRTSGSATSYNTSSDYRLKENVVDLNGAITRVKQLAPKRFNFIADADTTFDGFLAHEAQTVVPEAVTGTHNGVEVWKEGEERPDGVSVGDNKLDEDGNTIPDYQGIDQSKLVPLLTAALQEAISKIETLETQNTAQQTTIDTLQTQNTAQQTTIDDLLARVTALEAA